MTESIGLMEGAFFVSRGELLTWINNCFKLNLTKIEQLGTGAVYCQILDAIHPGKVPLSKVNWKSKYEWEFVNNFKVLQQCFLKLKMNKHIEVEKLVKAKYQDNLEFAQWMKRYYDLNNASNKDYDPENRRGVSDVDFSFSEKITHRHERSLTTGRSKELKSLSPGMRKFTKVNTSGPRLAPRKQSLMVEDKDCLNELARLQANLVEMKQTAINSNKVDAEMKLKHVFGLIELSLKSKLFIKGNDTDRGTENVLEKIVEND